MTYTQSTTTKSPFTTSTAFNAYGATSFNQNWISVAGTSPPVASMSGQGIAVTGFSGGYGRVYFTNNNHYEQSAASYYGTGQVLVASIDELIASGNSFSHVGVANPFADTTRSRTNIFRLGY